MSLIMNTTGNLVESLGSFVLSALDRMLLPYKIVPTNRLDQSVQLSCSLVLVLPFLLSKDQLLHWSMEVCLNVGKYLLHKVPKGFPDSNAGIIYNFA